MGVSVRWFHVSPYDMSGIPGELNPDGSLCARCVLSLLSDQHVPSDLFVGGKKWRSHRAAHIKWHGCRRVVVECRCYLWAGILTHVPLIPQSGKTWQLPPRQTPKHPDRWKTALRGPSCSIARPWCKTHKERIPGWEKSFLLLLNLFCFCSTLILNYIRMNSWSV